MKTNNLSQLLINYVTLVVIGLIDHVGRNISIATTPFTLASRGFVDKNDRLQVNNAGGTSQ